MEPIPVPTKTAQRLRSLIGAPTEHDDRRGCSHGQRLLDVPPDYELFNIDVGWQPKNRHTTARGIVHAPTAAAPS